MTQAGKLPYVHMIATAYSGSTLLGTLLDSHPEITTVGELITPVREGRLVREGGDYPCSCGSLLLECPHFTALVERCRERGVELDFLDYEIRIDGSLLGRCMPGHRKRVARAMERCTTIARALLDVTGKRVFLDTSKDLSPVPHLARHPELDLKVLHLVRDPRAFLHSTRKRREVKAASLSRHWRHIHARSLELGKSLGPERFRSLSFESFCARPDETLEELCSFLGVESVPLRDRADEVVHHIMGNRARLAPVGEIRLDESWRESLSNVDRRACLRAAGSIASAYGYA